MLGQQCNTLTLEHSQSRKCKNTYALSWQSLLNEMTHKVGHYPKYFLSNGERFYKENQMFYAYTSVGKEIV